ncbi:NAD(P)/FAD-dependent oxidoreductase [Streptomyces sp. L2]|uniref:flavin-containing monooxygenase n=1 Tax=Streptomyces sp. L2 TaxID=2162665 RepID=UPI0010120C82|nr:NAD(P)/FAD-dependent oxidoreductase [Streptomyces sp. L2]
MDQTIERVDVVIVGAGLSGIAAAVELKETHPERSFVMIEARADVGGTWDLFRYPGIRSDSDMFTLGYSFKPWTPEKSIASGGAILDYLKETVDEYGLTPHIRLGRRVLSADWSQDDRSWDLQIVGPTGRELVSCSYLYVAAGYYDHDGGHKPEFPGQSAFRGSVVHPQQWPDDLDCTGKRVAVIGSGATAITLVPALAQTASKVTMVQRSPSYVAIDSDVDEEANRLRVEVGGHEAFTRIRLRNTHDQQAKYRFARADPEAFKKPLFDEIEKIVGRDCRERHFTPAYEPWDQRLCLVPNGDLFHAIRDGRADVVTGHIETFTETGLRMTSGEEVPADVIVTATGLRLVTLGKILFSLDGEPIDFSKTFTYKGVAFSGVPNLLMAFGYLNSSWTLRLELVNRFWSSLLTRMDELGAAVVTPVLRDEDQGMTRGPWIKDVSSGYLVRHMGEMPVQGDRAPWINPQVHEQMRDLLSAPLEDGALRFS